MQPLKKPKIVFSPSNVDHYERVFRTEHDIAMGYQARPSPRVDDIVERANNAFPVPPHIHTSFRDWIEHNRQARFDCFREPSWLCTCYKCVTFQVQSDSEIAMFEAIKDEHEAVEFKSDGDVKGISTTDRMGFAATDERMQMLADIAARAAAEGTAPVIPGQFFGAVSCVCHFFTDINLNAPEGPQTPKITTIQVQPDYSDQGKEKAQKAWIRRSRVTPTTLRF